MYIRNLSTEKQYANATITLSYDEIRCVCNSLYRLTQLAEVEKETDLNQVYSDFTALFALVKHGKIPEHELKIMYELQCKEDKKTLN